MKRLLIALLLSVVALPTLAGSPPPVPTGFDIYREPITTAQHLDWLWQDYLTNGQLKAIEKITSALTLSSYSGALNTAQSMRSARALTDQEKQDAILDAVYQAAIWSLEANGIQHSAVADELGRIEDSRRDARDTPHVILLVILSKVRPEQFKVIDKSGGITFSTPRGNIRFVAARH